MIIQIQFDYLSNLHSLQLYMGFVGVDNWLPLKFSQIIRQINTIIERAVSCKRQRWGYLAFLYAYVLYRVFTYDYLGLLYIVGLYIIYLVVQYYTPSGLPDPDEDEEDSAFILQQSVSIMRSTEGDRPVLRSISEFCLWKNLLLIGLVSWAVTYFEVFLIPVYWPFLLIYFLWLIGLAITKHWRHMKKYGYSFSDFTLKKNPS